ncbi:hypothetical protein LIA77_11925 [Sarocladium implicatum]|nr:hypothetical protein LIA77_11925 [Sarocladium implicatum]
MRNQAHPTMFLWCFAPTAQRYLMYYSSGTPVPTLVTNFSRSDTLAGINTLTEIAIPENLRSATSSFTSDSSQVMNECRRYHKAVTDKPLSGPGPVEQSEPAYSYNSLLFRPSWSGHDLAHQAFLCVP